jgi:hypothetical protein
MMWDVYELDLPQDITYEHDRHNSGFVLAPPGYPARMNAPKSSSRITLIAPIGDVGGALLPTAITQSDEKSSIFAPSHVQLGTN